MFGLPESTQQQLIDCLTGFNEVRQAVIFGSRAIGSYRTGSDIDIALWLNTNDPLLIGRIASALDELSTPYLYDVVDYDAITHLPLKAHIERCGIKLKL